MVTRAPYSTGMISRVHFMLGAAASLAGLPLIAAADEPPQPSAAPSAMPSSAPPKKPVEPGHKEHVHGAKGVTRIPEGRAVEWKMEVLDGPEFRLTAYRGKVVFVNVFATWCGPCREEQPDVVAFARAHADDTAVIGVDIHEEDNDVRAYRKKYDIPYPIAMHRGAGTLPSIFVDGTPVYPTTVVFRPDGTLSCAWKGNRSRRWFEAEREHALES